MLSLVRWSSAGAALLIAVFAASGAGVAGPSHPRLIERQAAPTGLRTSRTLVMHYTGAPLQFHFRTLQFGPIKALPLIAPRTPVQVSPAFVPLFGPARFFAPGGSDMCGASRANVLLTALPTTPFTPVACDRDTRDTRDTRDLPTSLTPGGNRNALYGRAYSPHADEGP